MSSAEIFTQSAKHYRKNLLSCKKTGFPSEKLVFTLTVLILIWENPGLLDAKLGLLIGNLWYQEKAVYKKKKKKMASLG